MLTSRPIIRAGSTGGFGGLLLSVVPMTIDPAALRQLKEAIGEALMRWQHVETALFLIAHGLMGPDYEINSITFFHIKSAESKVSLTDKLIIHCCNKQICASRWKPIKREIENLITFRNGLAHFEGFFVYPTMMDAYPSALPVGIAPHHLLLDAAASRGGTVKCLTVESIERGSQDLLQITNALIAFACAHVQGLASKIDGLPPPMRAWWNGGRLFE